MRERVILSDNPAIDRMAAEFLRKHRHGVDTTEAYDELRDILAMPRGKVPLSVKDTTAQDLLWEYAQRRRVVDAEFSDDLEAALKAAGYAHSPTRCLRVVAPCTSKAAYVEMRELQGDEPCKRCGQYCPGGAKCPDSAP